LRNGEFQLRRLLGERSGDGESTDQGQFDDVAAVGWLDGAWFRAILFQRPVRAMPVIIAQVFSEYPAQVSFVEDDDVVQTFPAHGADQPFDRRVLPR
jgi:hypothetical protein